MRYLMTAMLVVGLCISATRADEGSKEPIRVPFKLLKSGHFIVETKLNGKGPYLLIFDTGAPTNLINNRIAKDAGVLTKGTPKPFFAPFGSMGEFKVKTLTVGDVETENLSVMVMDHPTVEVFSTAFKRELGSPVDGIIGMPFFGRFRMTVDYQAKELTFVPNGFQPANLMESMTKAMMSGQKSANQPKIVSAAGLWGFTVGKDDDDEAPGVIVREVLADSAAAKAGLKVGDRLLTLDGRWTDSIPDCHQAASFIKPGKAATLVLKRGDKELKVAITPAKGL